MKESRREFSAYLSTRENIRCSIEDVHNDSYFQQTTNVAVSVGKLVEAKRMALRRGIWFRVLDRIERGLLDLTMKYVDSIRSPKLANLVVVIVEKLKQASETIVDRMVRTVGLPLSQKTSSLAVGWGNHAAVEWADDREFARFLAISIAKK